VSRREIDDQLRLDVERDGEHDESAVAVALPQAFYARHFLPARLAPGRPEVQQYHLLALFAQRERAVGRKGGSADRAGAATRTKRLVTPRARRRPESIAIMISFGAILTFSSNQSRRWLMVGHPLLRALLFVVLALAACPPLKFPKRTRPSLVPLSQS
jgi:hypothetical protein